MADAGSGYFRGMITGLLFGAAAALLLAPKRGDDLRQDLAESATKLKERAGELNGSLNEKAHDLQEHGEHLLADARNGSTDALAQTLDVADRVKEEVKDGTHDVIDSV